MTDKQLEAARQEIKARYPDPDEEWSDEDADTAYELRCRDMINTILVYGGADAVKKGSNKYMDSLLPFTRHPSPHGGVISVSRLDELIAEQLDSFSRAKVVKNSYTDSEGVSYNSIVWEDD